MLREIGVQLGWMLPTGAILFMLYCFFVEPNKKPRR